MADINTSCALVPGRWICRPEPVLLTRGAGGGVQRMGQADSRTAHCYRGAPKVASKMPTGIVKYWA